MLIDSHSHFDLESFDPDRAQVWKRAQDSGVKAQIVPAITADGWPRLKQVCSEYPGLYPAYGMHPMFCQAHMDSHIQLLRDWIETERPVAVGECGLDFYIKDPNKKRQQQFFESQLELAGEFRLPVIIHARKAVEDVFNLLRIYPGVKAVLHSFSGSIQQAEKLIDMGHLLGFGGPITYPNATRLKKLVAELPLDSILLESDSPDQPVSQHQGQRNEPSCLAVVLEHFSAIRHESPETIAQQTTENAKRFFGIEI